MFSRKALVRIEKQVYQVELGDEAKNVHNEDIDHYEDILCLIPSSRFYIYMKWFDLCFDRKLRVSEHECLTELSLSYWCFSLSRMSSSVNGNSTPDTLPLGMFSIFISSCI